LLRRNYGEAVESLAGGEYYWMAGNFMKYAAADAVFGSKNASDIPVDSNELIALVRAQAYVYQLWRAGERRRSLARSQGKLHGDAACRSGVAVARSQRFIADE
jgi:hypothetical protein